MSWHSSRSKPVCETMVRGQATRARCACWCAALPGQPSMVRRSKEFKRVLDDGIGSLVGDEMRGAVDDFQRQIVGVVLVTPEESGADNGVFGPDEEACRCRQPGAPVGPAHYPPGFARDEAAVEGRGCPCPGRVPQPTDEELNVLLRPGAPISGVIDQQVAGESLVSPAQQPRAEHGCDDYGLEPQAPHDREEAGVEPEEGVRAEAQVVPDAAGMVQA